MLFFRVPLLLLYDNNTIMVLLFAGVGESAKTDDKFVENTAKTININFLCLRFAIYR